jgi:hypothetical protein
MKRFHLIEIHDQDWCPKTVRDAETDYLQFTISATTPYAAMAPILAARSNAPHTEFQNVPLLSPGKRPVGNDGILNGQK